MSVLSTSDFEKRTNAMEIGGLIREAQRLIGQLRQLKDTHKPEHFTWYGYDTLGNFSMIDHLVKNHRDLFRRVHGRPIADIGAADGDVAFILEQLGYNLEIIDNPPTNWNGLRGAYRLKELLNSNVAIHEIDLDRQFDLPHRDYGLVLFLGILYHLKNPFYVLERLAESAEYCLLSTRVARQSADRSVQLGKASVAYLLDADECNNDSTNYWIFSKPGLFKILKRTGWEVLESTTGGDTKASDPSSPDHDERAFLLLRSSINR